MLSKNDVYGVVVTYHPNESLRRNVLVLLSQVAGVVIVDNGSHRDAKVYVAEMGNVDGVEIVENSVNMGIAYALNQGLARASASGYKLCLTMDQDSTLNGDCVSKMIDALNNNAKLVSVGPTYNGGNMRDVQPYTEKSYLITSGNLTYTDIAISVGGYNNALFIDAVDFDFALSLRSQGHKLAMVNGAKMEHRLGSLAEASILTLPIRIRTHVPVRHYYMFRNHCYLTRKYIWRFPGFLAKKQVALCKHLFECLLLHPNKLENFALIIKGIRHGFQSKYGKYAE